MTLIEVVSQFANDESAYRKSMNKPQRKAEGYLILPAKVKNNDIAIAYLK